jgi:hypothetical protein
MSVVLHTRSYPPAFPAKAETQDAPRGSPTRTRDPPSLDPRFRENERVRGRSAAESAAPSCIHRRHARTCSGHPRLPSRDNKPWMAGPRPAMTEGSGPPCSSPRRRPGSRSKGTSPRALVPFKPALRMDLDSGFRRNDGEGGELCSSTVPHSALSRESGSPAIVGRGAQAGSVRTLLPCAAEAESSAGFPLSRE